MQRRLEIRAYLSDPVLRGLAPVYEVLPKATVQEQKGASHEVPTGVKKVSATETGQINEKKVSLCYIHKCRQKVRHLDQ